MEFVDEIPISVDYYKFDEVLQMYQNITKI